MKTITLKISRYDPEKDSEPRYEKYEIPFEPKMRVLHGIRYIQENIDGTLAFRWNCGIGRCGSCAMEVNGFPRLTCKHEITEGINEITVEPIKVFPVIKDLLTDVSSMLQTAREIPSFSPKGNGENFWKIMPEDIEVTKEFRKCIECYICQDTCHVIRNHKMNYIGPRWVAKIASLDKHPMDSTDRSEFLNKRGIGLCNVTRCCQEVCPEHIKITENAIIPEKERIITEHSPITTLKRKFFGESK